jgi:hypothetical protein
MNRPLQRVQLQHKNARSSHGGRIVLDNDSAADTSQDIAYRYIILAKLIIAVIRNADSAAFRKRANVNESVTQWKSGPDSHSAASLAPLFRCFSAFASTGPKNFPV